MFKVITEKPVALDSPDHVDPYGAILNNTGNMDFNIRLNEIFNGEKFSIIDFGCAGGCFILECAKFGHKAIGLEGSDEPLKRGLFNWPEFFNKNLFLCDVTEPFKVLFDEESFTANVITSWEFLEHISPSKIDMVLQNTVDHLVEDGLYICSISSGTEDYCKAKYGVEWGPYEIFKNPKFNHQNQNTPEYWDKKFADFGFIKRDDLRDSFHGEFIRGPGHGCAEWATEERIKDVSGISPENQIAVLNRIYQLKRKK